MRAFLSHSSTDKEVVIAVHEGLEKDSTWLDRAEIEWGELFLEKIADGISSASDFVLFWSAAAARSEWVRLEVNMAFIQALRRKAIRLRVVNLDSTPLPLYLQPFQAFSVEAVTSPAAEILKKLVPLLREPVRSARSRFVNRHNEIKGVEGSRRGGVEGSRRGRVEGTSRRESKGTARIDGGVEGESKGVEGSRRGQPESTQVENRQIVGQVRPFPHF